MHDLSYTAYPNNNSIKPKSLVVLLHGYGSNSADLMTLVPDLVPYIKDALFISPNAPFNFEGGSPNSYQWYSLLQRSSKYLQEGYEKAKPILNNFIQKVLTTHSLTYQDLVLAGFSQGGMMALQYGIHSQNQLKGIISFSGYMLDENKPNIKLNNKSPILLTHGDMDSVVPFNAYEKCLKKLKSLDFQVIGHVSNGLTHGIDYGCLKAAQNFLKSL